MENSTHNESINRSMNASEPPYEGEKFQKIKKRCLLVLFVTLVIIKFIYPMWATFDTKQTFTLRTKSDFFQAWNNRTFGHEVHAYIFDIKNPEETANGKKPIFEEVGPFVYDTQAGKFNQKNLHADDALSSRFQATSNYLFNAEKSNGLSEKDNLTVLNFMVLGIPNAIMKVNTDLLFNATQTVDKVIKNAKHLFVNATARTILFDGIEEFLEQEIGDNVGDRLHMYSIEDYDVCNDKDEETDKLGNRKNKKNKYYYEENEETHITGSSIYHDYQDHNKEHLNGAFDSHHFSYHFDSTVDILNFKVHRFITSMGSELNFKLEDKCSYMYSGHCLENFGYVLSRYFNTILFVSNPHFYTTNTDHTVEGFNPDKKKHMMFSDIDPDTGEVISFHYRIQYNLLQIKKCSVRLVPLLWLDEVAGKSDSELEVMNKHKNYVSYIKYLLIILTAIFYFYT